MKGSPALFAAIVFLGILIVLFIGFGVSLNLFGGGEGTISKTSLQSNIYTMGNALDASKLYMDTSLGYSLYQACYDNLAKGGRASITTDTGQTISDRQYAYLPSSFTQDNFLNELASSVNINLNMYGGSSYVFLSEYRVSIPDYTEIRIAPDASDTSRLSVSTVTSGRMVTTARSESGESIILQGPADLSGQYSMPCLTIFLKGQELNPDIEQAFQDAFDQAFQELSASSCSDRDACTQILKTSLESKLGIKPPVTSAGYTAEAELLDAQVTAVGQDTDAQGNIQYVYTAKAFQKVTVRESNPPDEHFYPVWTGNEISFEALELVFINRASS
jgi:hypothetical protein